MFHKEDLTSMNPYGNYKLLWAPQIDDTRPQKTWKQIPAQHNGKCAIEKA